MTEAQSAKWKVVWTPVGSPARIEYFSEYAPAQEFADSLRTDRSKNVSVRTVTDSAEYDAWTLPTDWSWHGAVAGPDGFNGRAYVANVAQDPQGQLWVFTWSGRYRIHREEFARRIISGFPLEGLPLQLDPAEDLIED